MVFPSSPSTSDTAERLRIFRALVPYFGTVQSSAFFQRTSEFIAGVQRIHPFIEGIYKPAGATYALSISSMLASPYSDEVFFNADRTWWMRYSSKKGAMDHAMNASLIRCITDRQPLLVLRQISDKTSREGSRHRLLGLGFVENFDPASSLFRIRGLEWGEVSVYLGIGLSDDLIETALRLESLEEWIPFAAEDRAVYQISRQKRDAAFRSIVLANYGHTCAVTGQKFHSPHHVEADGAHIIGKEVRGTDDPRNGIALSKSAHWAFDRGIFTISDQYEIVVNPKISSASVANFPAIELDRRKVLLPDDPYYRPHPDALAWHKAEVFDRFAS
ncbi:MAG: putative restriction endonuclease [Verrucomicrobiota bacterium]|jgi:putative restriction endonuclease